MEQNLKKDVAITVLYDNNQSEETLSGACGKWGFSCVVFGLDDTILFDTGADDGLMLKNMNEAGIDPVEIDIVVLSHGHWDHIGGLENLLRSNPDVTVYMPASLGEELKEGCIDYGAEVIEVTAEEEISEGVHLIYGFPGKIDEISLALDTKSGLVILTGCAHAGIDLVVKRAMEVTGFKDTLVALGGYHTMKLDVAEIKGIVSRLKKLGLKNVAPCHCTGDVAFKLLKKAFGDNFIEVGAGFELRTEDLG